MLSIRMQRLGRKGHAMYRVVVQDSRRAPNSGKYVALLGSYDPHNKTSSITKKEAELYLKNGAQPSDRVVKLFKSEKISLPKWVEPPAKQKRAIRNPDKLRKNQPPKEKPPVAVTETSSETSEAEKTSADEVKAEDPVASESIAPETSEAMPVSEAKAKLEEVPKTKSDDIEKGDDETKTPPNEDEFPEDKKAEAETEKP